MKPRGAVILGRPEFFFTYTCKHGHDAIGTVGNVVPLKRLLTTNVLDTADETTRLIASYAWFTSLENVTEKTAFEIGLNRVELGCNRWEYRYRVSTKASEKLVSWSLTRLTWPDHIVQALEHSAPGIRPETWYTSQHPVMAFYEPYQEKPTGWKDLVSDPARQA